MRMEMPYTTLHYTDVKTRAFKDTLDKATGFEMQNIKQIVSVLYARCVCVN